MIYIYFSINKEGLMDIHILFNLDYKHKSMDNVNMFCYLSPNNLVNYMKYICFLAGKDVKSGKHTPVYKDQIKKFRDKFHKYEFFLPNKKEVNIKYIFHLPYVVFIPDIHIYQFAHYTQM